MKMMSEISLANSNTEHSTLETKRPVICLQLYFYLTFFFVQWQFKNKYYYNTRLNYVFLEMEF